MKRDPKERFIKIHMDSITVKNTYGFYYCKEDKVFIILAQM